MRMREKGGECSNMLHSLKGERTRKITTICDRPGQYEIVKPVLKTASNETPLSHFEKKIFTNVTILKIKIISFSVQPCFILRVPIF